MKKDLQQTSNSNLIMAIYADDKKGLLGQILMLFNRRSYTIYDLSVARTDIKDIILITIEAQLSPGEANTITHKIRNIIEVHEVISYPANEVKLNKIAYFKLSGKCLDHGLWTKLQKYGATITEMQSDALIVQKIGTDQDLDELYQQLDGEFLISYCKSGLVIPQSMIALDSLFQDA